MVQYQVTVYALGLVKGKWHRIRRRKRYKKGEGPKTLGSGLLSRSVKQSKGKKNCAR